MEKNFFGKDLSGNDIYKYTIIDANGNSLSVLNYGATIQSLNVKNNSDKLVDVVLGYDNIDQYQVSENRPYLGAVCGRVAGRIKDAKFTIEAQEYNLSKTAGNSCLHGGVNGFDKKFFDLTDVGEDYLTFSTFSQDGEEGFPGNLALSVKYTFRNNLLLIEYLATVTDDCPVNITNHTYFNLDGCGDINNHKLSLNSNFYLGMGDDCIANGMVLPVKDTYFDFTTSKKLGKSISEIKSYQPILGGIDYYFFANYGQSNYRKFGTLENSDNTLKMDIYTNQVGAQIYTGNFLQKSVGKGISIDVGSGIAVETQFPPNNLSYSHLPNMILKKDERYYHKTGYRFY